MSSKRPSRERTQAKLVNEVKAGPERRLQCRCPASLYELIQQYSFLNNRTVSDLTLEMWTRRLRDFEPLPRGPRRG